MSSKASVKPAGDRHAQKKAARPGWGPGRAAGPVGRGGLLRENHPPGGAAQAGVDAEVGVVVGDHVLHLAVALLRVVDADEVAERHLPHDEARLDGARRAALLLATLLALDPEFPVGCVELTLEPAQRVPGDLDLLLADLVLDDRQTLPLARGRGAQVDARLLVEVDRA